MRRLTLLTGLMEAGKLRSVIDRYSPLEHIAEAHRSVGTGHKQGDVVIMVLTLTARDVGVTGSDKPFAEPRQRKESSMHFGIFLPPFGPCADVATLVTLSALAEEAGWDGFFLWDDVTINTPIPVADPWIALSAMALRTRALRLGALVTPLPRRRPWKVARETVTLDHLSQGRLIVGVGLGADPAEFDDLGEEADLKVRAAILGEGLDILTGLWSGEPFQYEGVHYQIRNAQFLPRPFQSPRIPVWMGGTWPAKAPFRRAARWDGVFPLGRDLSLTEMLSPEEVQAIRRFTLEQRAQAGLLEQPFEVAHAGITSGADREQDHALAQTYAAAGVTWWLEHLVPVRWGSWSNWPLEAMRQRILQGPPRLVEKEA